MSGQNQAQQSAHAMCYRAAWTNVALRCRTGHQSDPGFSMQSRFVIAGRACTHGRRTTASLRRQRLADQSLKAIECELWVVLILDAEVTW